MKGAENTHLHKHVYFALLSSQNNVIGAHSCLTHSGDAV